MEQIRNWKLTPEESMLLYSNNFWRVSMLVGGRNATLLNTQTGEQWASHLCSGAHRDARKKQTAWLLKWADTIIACAEGSYAVPIELLAKTVL